MTGLTSSRGRVTASRVSSTGKSDKPADPRAVAEAVCAIAYNGGKTGGVYATTPAIVQHRLRLPAPAVEAGVEAGISWGWMRRPNGQIELTAAGLYMAKLVLKLPT